MQVIYFVTALVLAGISIAKIVMPEDMIYMRYHRWFQDAEPTELHIRRERIGGIAGVIVAAIILVVTFIQ